jgi:hypothetical protein
VAEKTEPPKGIGGWLIFVVIGLIISPIRVAYLLATTHWPIFLDGTWEVLTTPGSEAYHPLWAPLVIFEIIGNLGVIALAVVTLWHLVRKSRHTPKLAIIWLAWTAIFIAVDFFAADLIPAVAAESDPGSDRELVRSLVSAAIWIPYFLVSKRVKATFVN